MSLNGWFVVIGAVFVVGGILAIIFRIRVAAAQNRVDGVLRPWFSSITVPWGVAIGGAVACLLGVLLLLHVFLGFPSLSELMPT